MDSGLVPGWRNLRSPDRVLCSLGFAAKIPGAEMNRGTRFIFNPTPLKIVVRSARIIERDSRSVTEGLAAECSTRTPKYVILVRVIGVGKGIRLVVNATPYKSLMRSAYATSAQRILGNTFTTELESTSP